MTYYQKCKQYIKQVKASSPDKVPCACNEAKGVGKWMMTYRRVSRENPIRCARCGKPLFCKWSSEDGGIPVVEVVPCPACREPEPAPSHVPDDPIHPIKHWLRVRCMKCSRPLQFEPHYLRGMEAWTDSLTNIPSAMKLKVWTCDTCGARIGMELVIGHQKEKGKCIQ